MHLIMFPLSYDASSASEALVPALVRTNELKLRTGEVEVRLLRSPLVCDTSTCVSTLCILSSIIPPSLPVDL